MHSAPDTSRDLLKARIRAAGLRATPGRTRVLECLLSSSTPLTHAEVCDRLDLHDRASLYRNLVDLTNAGLLTRTDLGDRLWRFEVAGDGDHEASAHAHFLCQSCGDVSCLPEEAVSLSDVPTWLQAANVDIQVRGLCNTCG